MPPQYTRESKLNPKRIDGALAACASGSALGSYQVGGGGVG